MTLDEEINWWKTECDKMSKKELAMVCFGIATGLKLAKEDYSAKQERSKNNSSTSAKKA